MTKSKTRRSKGENASLKACISVIGMGAPLFTFKKMVAAKVDRKMKKNINVSVRMTENWPPAAVKAITIAAAKKIHRPV